MPLSQKQKSFSQFFLQFKNLYQSLNIRHKKMTLIAYVFPEQSARKNMVR